MSETQIPEQTLPENENTPQIASQDKRPSGQNFYIPFAIVIAGALIACSIFFSNVYKAKLAYDTTKQAGGVAGQVAGQDDQAAQQQAAKLAEKVRPISSADHIRGSANAPVKLIEFVDLECPYCDQVHPTIKKIQEKYGAEKIAWVYRHFPLTSIHPLAPVKAQAAECASDLGGNDIFWKYVDALFAKQQETRTEEQVIALATTVGLSKSQFAACMKDGKAADKILADSLNGQESGVRGTPYMIFTANGKYVPVSGAQRLESIEAQIKDLVQ